jgi:hypothetical protein
VGERSITLEDGTKLRLAEGISVDTVQEGAILKIVVEERDGQRVATNIERSE